MEYFIIKNNNVNNFIFLIIKLQKNHIATYVIIIAILMI